MRLPPHDNEGPLLGVGTANDRLKAGRRITLHRSILASVLIHVGIIVGWPAMDLPTLASGEATGSGYLELVSLGSFAAPGPARALAPTWVEEAAEDAEEEGGASGDEGADVGEGETAPGGWEERSAELWRLAALRPRMVDRAPDPAEDEGDEDADGIEEASDGDEREGLQIRRGSADLEYQRLSEEEMLSLERLSSLRPELVLVSPSSWLVLRNPKEVGEFMQTRFEAIGLGGDVRGSLSVSLWVDERGSVEWAEINRSSGHEPLDATAIELFQDVVAFRPAREEGMRVPVAAVFWLMW
ncbi:MAG: energy transducer TonB [Gemmatimonadota bacterium]